MNDDPNERAAGEALMTAAQGGAENSWHVLVIDDNDLVRAGFCRAFTQSGYSVQAVDSAEGALAAIDAKRFDLIVSDIMMPEVDGTELVEMIRARGVDTPVVFITGNPELRSAMKAVELGVVRYLAKPVSTRTLIEVASAAIRVYGLARAERLALDNESLRSLLDELNRARAAERAANRAKSDFLEKMSHDLRTPLSDVIGYTELVLMGELSDDQRKSLKISLDAALALSKQIQDILQFSELHQRIVSLDAVSFNPWEILENTLTPLREKAQRKRVEVTVEIDQSLPDRIVGDPRKLSLVLRHLVENATKFTAPGGSIEIRIREHRARRRAFVSTPWSKILAWVSLAKSMQPPSIYAPNATIPRRDRLERGWGSRPLVCWSS